MPARATTRVGLLYESLGGEARGSDGRFPPTLVVVIYTGHRPWRSPDDLGGLVRLPVGHPLPWLTGRRYARLDLRDPATQYPKRGNRMAALTRLSFPNADRSIRMVDLRTDRAISRRYRARLPLVCTLAALTTLLRELGTQPGMPPGQAVIVGTFLTTAVSIHRLRGPFADDGSSRRSPGRRFHCRSRR